MGIINHEELVCVCVCTNKVSQGLIVMDKVQNLYLSLCYCHGPKNAFQHVTVKEFLLTMNLSWHKYL